MRNQNRWQPSKFIYRNGKLIASRDPKEVAFGSRLMADIIADYYDTNLRKYSKGKLLDLGCGKVPLFIVYKDYTTDCVCVDWNNTSHTNEYLDFECDITNTLPFRDWEFDTIILSDVLEHISEPEHLWREMSRLLAPGGRVIMNVPFYYWVHEAPYDYYRYTEFKLRDFVESSGLKLLQLSSIGGVPEIMTDIFAKNICSVPIIGRFFAVFAQWITFVFIKTKFGKKVSEATKKAFPFGYFLVAEK